MSQNSHGNNLLICTNYPKPYSQKVTLNKLSAITPNWQRSQFFGSPTTHPYRKSPKDII